MNVIYKYPLKNTDIDLVIPARAEPIYIDVQNGNAYMWIMLDPEEEKIVRRFVVIGTGQERITRNMEYVGTWQALPFVWHLFEVLPPIKK